MGNPFNSITLSQLYNFHTLARTQHFTDAARELYITQPTLSASIKALETELDTPLLIREGRRSVRLSKQGKEFDQKLGAILSDLEDAIAQTRHTAEDAPPPTLLLGTIPTIQYDFLPSLLKRYWDTYGYQSRVRISVEFSNPLIKGLKNQDYEIIFCAHVPEEQDLEFITMLTKPLVAVVNKKSFWAKRSSFSLQELSKYEYASYNSDTPIGRETRRLMEQHGIPAPVVGLDDEFMLSSAVQSNKGLVGIMLHTSEIDPFKDDVCVLPIEEVDETWHPICLAYDPRLHVSKQAQRFIDIARDYARAQRHQQTN